MTCMQRCRQTAMCKRKTNSTNGKEQRDTRVQRDRKKMHIFRFSFQHNRNHYFFGAVSNIRLGSFVKSPTNQPNMILFIHSKAISFSVPFDFFHHFRRNSLLVSQYLCSVIRSLCVFLELHYSLWLLSSKCSYNGTPDSITSQDEKLTQENEESKTRSDLFNRESIF